MKEKNLKPILEDQINDEFEVYYLEVIEFEDENDLTQWLGDYENEEYMDLLQHKLLSYVFSEEKNKKINLFIADIDTFQSLVFIYNKDVVKILDKLIKFYANTDDFNRCSVLKEAKEIFLSKR